MRSSVEIDLFIESLKLPWHLNLHGMRFDNEYRIADLFMEFFVSSDPSRITMERFARFGLIYGYGDSFAYNGKGIVVIGSTGYGKTTLVDGLAKVLPEKVKVLGNDSSLLYQKPDDPQLKVFAYPYDLEGSSWPDVVRRCIDYVETDPGFPVETMIYIDQTKGKPGFIERATNWRPPLLARQYLYGVNVNYSMLNGVRFLHYNNPHIKHSVESRVREVATKLDNLI